MLLVLDDRPPYCSVLDVVPPFDSGTAGSIIRERTHMHTVLAVRDYEETAVTCHADHLRPLQTHDHVRRQALAGLERRSG
jgi:hypothetical protein